ncbi:unnamed protein product [Parajaminaea phylloscopi]
MSANAESAPSAQQVLFARCVIHTFFLWPSMRLAVEEQWGGRDSADKRDFLISHICDLYGGEPGASSLGPFEPTLQGHPSGGTSSEAASSSSSSSAVPYPPPAPESPEPGDLADLLAGYLADEYEAVVEDGSCDYIAERIVGLHKVVFAQPDVVLGTTAGASHGEAAEAAQRVLDQAQRAVAPLDEAAEKLRLKALPKAQQGKGNGDDDAESEASGESDDDDDEAMDVDMADGSAQSRGQPSSRPEPIVDEDGFTTVTRGKKR